MPEGGVELILTDAENQWQPQKADNPWKRNSSQGQSEVYRKMLGILNKVTKSSIDVLVDQAVILPLMDPDNLNDVLLLLLQKVQEETIFVPTYVRFCRELAGRIDIGGSLAAACEQHYLDLYQQLLSYPDFQGIPPPLHMLKEEYNTRRHANTIMGFICELCKVNIVPINQVIEMGRNIFSHDDKRSLECLCRVLTFGGKLLKQHYPDFVDESFSYIEYKLEERNLPLRLKFLLQDTQAIRASDWRAIPPHHNRSELNTLAPRNFRG